MRRKQGKREAYILRFNCSQTFVLRLNCHQAFSNHIIQIERNFKSSASKPSFIFKMSKYKQEPIYNPLLFLTHLS